MKLSNLDKLDQTIYKRIPELLLKLLDCNTLPNLTFEIIKNTSQENLLNQAYQHISHQDDIPEEDSSETEDENLQSLAECL